MVCVIGIGIVSSLGLGVGANLASLRQGKDGLSKVECFDTVLDVPVGEIKMTNDELKRKAGINEKKVVSRTSLLGMLAAEEALQDANIDDRSKVAFISSTTVGGMDLTPLFYKQFMHDNTKGQLRYVAQHDCASSTDAIADYCRIGGFRTAISTACSSAANALMMGARMIEQGLVDTAVVGGTDALCAYTLDGFKSLMILDSEKCRPFDDSRSGLNLGEAAAYIVLQRSDIANNSYCSLAGYGNANDAFHQTAVSETGNGPRMAMEAAINKAGINISDISYINAHGTGTPNNDASETAAMISIWDNDLPKFSSTKSFTGHTLAAAGAIEAVFSILAIKHQQIWANLNFKTPMSGSALTPVTSLQNCEVKSVLSNSFGFGGNCSSVIFSRL